MPVVRGAVLAIAVVVCAWFVLGAIQTRDLNRATSLIDTSTSPSPALTVRILGLLADAGTLNPDKNVELERSQALTRARLRLAGVQAAEQVARDEPMNANAWVVLRFAAGPIDPPLARYATTQLLKLVPPAPAAP